MRRFALALGPVVLAVGLVSIILLARNRREGPPHARDDSAAAPPAAAGSETSAEATRLRQEIESLRRDVEAQRERAERAEAELARLGTESEAEGSKPVKNSGDKAGAERPGWKKRRDSELEARVKGIAWLDHVKALIDYWKEMEKARAEGRAPRMDPDLIQHLTKLQSDSIELAKLLGLEGPDVYRAFQNELIGEAWMDALLQEVAGGTLTPDQLARLRSTSLYREDPDFDRDGNLMEAWKLLIEQNRAYTAETMGIFTPDQQARVARTVTPTFMLSVYAAYSERTVSAPDGNTARAVADYWLESFKLGEDHRAAVEAVAQEYVQRQAALAQGLAAQYGARLPPEAEYQLLLGSLDAQIAAERRLAETLHVDAERAKKFLRGSGSVLRLSW